MPNANNRNDVVQINLLTFAPFGNPNRDESGHPKTMTLAGSLRGRWSTQSQKAALRSSPDFTEAGKGIRSRNLAIETFLVTRAAGLPERHCFAAAEIVRAGLGNGKLRTAAETITAMIDFMIIARPGTWRDDVLLAFPTWAPPAVKAARKQTATPVDAIAENNADASEAEFKEKSEKYTVKIAAYFLGSQPNLGYRENKGETHKWDDKWSTKLSCFEICAGPNLISENAILGVFRASQPLLFSTKEVAWKDGFEADLVAEWNKGDDGDVRAVLESRTHNGQVVSPMPTEAIDIDIALFGRMVASMPEATVEGALSIAHSMTVGEFQIEADFFSAGEERPRDGNDKVGHLGHAFCGTGIHHRYLSIDMATLRGNLEIGGRSIADAHALAENLVGWVIKAFSTTLPRGKSNNSATFSPASYVLVERGTSPATNLAVAFSSPISTSEADPMAAAIKRLRDHKASLMKVYGAGKLAELCAHPDVVMTAHSVESIAEAVAAVAA